MDSCNKPKGNGNQPMNWSESQSQQGAKLPQTQLQAQSQAQSQTQTQLQSISNSKYEKIMNLSSNGTAIASGDHDHETKTETDGDSRQNVILKIALLGDSNIGLDTLFQKYIDHKHDEKYVHYMEKHIPLKNVDVAIRIEHLCAPGQKEFDEFMPLCCADAQCIVFGFDLTQQASLFSVKRWFKEARKENATFIPFLIGTRFELFELMSDDYKSEVTLQATQFQQKMDAPLIFTWENMKVTDVKKIFKIIVAKVCDLKPNAKNKALKKQKQKPNQNKNGNQTNSQNNESIGMSN